ncbi:MAG: RagB/SusD family nutrient uptake outer membrane protein [Tannerella sp.]|nr:RagB/SusD family nutrient uptake outer membrane protein [Tannerella sp.]
MTTVSAQQIIGKVTDNRTNESIIGASVVIKGGQNESGTLTDLDGNFNINVSSLPVTIVIRYIGYTPQEIDVYEVSSSLIILLTENVNLLNEVVVVGYGTQRKSDVTGSIATIKQDAIHDVKAISIDQKLIGQTAGVQIQQISGIPGGGTSVKIRGNGSLGAGNEPLYVVDGIPYSAEMNQSTKPPVSSPTNRCGDNFPIIRFSDVLLSYAESLNEQGQTDVAVLYVTQVRARAGLPALPSYEQKQLRQLIENERQVEFCFENHRWYDLKRTGRALDVLKEHGIREKQRKSFIYETAFQMDSCKLLAPIPAEQILINGIEQNPKY